MASYQSAAMFYEVGFNHFFRAPNDEDGGTWFTIRVTFPPAFIRGLLSKAA